MKGHVRFQHGSFHAVIFQGRKLNSRGKLADSYRSIGGFATQREAQKELSRQLVAKQEGSYVEPHEMTLGHYLQHWLSVKKTSLSPTTHQRYEEICRDNIIPALGRFRLIKLSALDVEVLHRHADQRPQTEVEKTAGREDRKRPFSDYGFAVPSGPPQSLEGRGQEKASHAQRG
jgi:hypothetical protein